MMIPVTVQFPNKPQTRREVGMAADNLTAEEAAAAVGVPPGCLIDGKINNRKGQKSWNLVAYVYFVERPVEDIVADVRAENAKLRRVLRDVCNVVEAIPEADRMRLGLYSIAAFNEAYALIGAP